jgi:alanyl-tRNA synthetase
MDRKELIKKYIEFFKSKGHKEIANSSLVPENDPTVLFTTAGMHPIVPFLLGQKHFSGKRLVNVQRCIRTGDIYSVGDTIHHTLFEMLGNWSLGDYFKKEAIEFSFEFLTEVLKIPVEKLAVTCFAGDKDAVKDEESAETWQSLGIGKDRIAFLPKENNWWGPAGLTGPCGPDTEMFYWKSSKPTPKKFNPKDSNWVEIWNDVFMQYVKTEKEFQSAKQQNVDTGMGVERTIAVLNGLEDNYLGDCFLPIIKEIESISKKKYGKNEGETRAMRIVADHIKAAVFIIADGVVPSNVERGYVLRRLIRRAIRYGKELGIKENFTAEIAEPVFEIYDDYSNLNNKSRTLGELEKEEDKFRETLGEGLKAAEKIFANKTPIEEKKFIKLMQIDNKKPILRQMFFNKESKKTYSIKEANISEGELDKAIIHGNESFLLFQSYGFPIEMIIEFAREKHLIVDGAGFREELKKHQELSRTASAGQFKSGLADNSEATTRLHTAAHLLLAALRKVLGKDIHQKGSNITPERVRFDFSFDGKLTQEEISKVEKLVNEQISKKIEVKMEELTLEQARKSGAEGIFEDKYKNLDKIRVYSIGDFSKEICSGPHVKNLKELGKFKILKEESSSAGVRRIKAVLE